jgi:hypothetical protein
MQESEIVGARAELAFTTEGNLKRACAKTSAHDAADQQAILDFSWPVCALPRGAITAKIDGSTQKV